MPAIQFEVVGRVQGVGFRWFVLQAAQRTKLSGWVRNLPGGGVEIAAAGSAEAIQDMRHALRCGPPGAIVHDVMERSGAVAGDLPFPFEIYR